MTASRRFSNFEDLFLEAVTDLERRGGGLYLGPSAPTWLALDRLVSEEAFVSSTSLAQLLAPEYPEVGWTELAAHLASELEPGAGAEQGQGGGREEGPGAVAAILERHFHAPARARAWLDDRLRSTGTAAWTNYAEALAEEQGVRAMARLCRTAERVDARVGRALKTYRSPEALRRALPRGRRIAGAEAGRPRNKAIGWRALSHVQPGHDGPARQEQDGRAGGEALTGREMEGPLDLLATPVLLCFRPAERAILGLPPSTRPQEPPKPRTGIAMAPITALRPPCSVPVRRPRGLHESGPELLTQPELPRCSPGSSGGTACRGGHPFQPFTTPTWSTGRLGPRP